MTVDRDGFGNGLLVVAHRYFPNVKTKPTEATIKSFQTFSDLYIYSTSSGRRRQSKLRIEVVLVLIKTVYIYIYGANRSMP